MLMPVPPHPTAPYHFFPSDRKRRSSRLISNGELHFCRLFRDLPESLKDTEEGLRAGKHIGPVPEEMQDIPLLPFPNRSFSGARLVPFVRKKTSAFLTVHTMRHISVPERRIDDGKKQEDPPESCRKERDLPIHNCVTMKNNTYGYSLSPKTGNHPRSQR